MCALFSPENFAGWAVKGVKPLTRATRSSLKMHLAINVQWHLLGDPQSVQLVSATTTTTTTTTTKTCVVATNGLV